MRTRLAALILVASSAGCALPPDQGAKYEPPDERFVLFREAVIEGAQIVVPLLRRARAGDRRCDESVV